MNTFLRKVVLFVLLFLVLGQSTRLVDYWSGPYWANEVINAKISYIKDAPKFDIIFFGSSRTYRQIVPSVIDSVLGTKSFNLGGGATANPEAWYIIEHLLEDLPEEKKPKYLVIELQETIVIADKNKGTVRSEYALDYKRMRYVTKHFLEQHNSRNATTYFASFLSKTLFMSSVSEQLKAILKRKTRYNRVKDDIAKLSGYRSLESDISKGHLNRRNTLLSDPASLTLREKKILNEYVKDNYKPSSHEVNLHKENTSLCKSKKIIPIFYKPPRIQEILGLYKTIDYSSKIDMSDPNIYPEFYSVENSYDIGHMNENGAELYSIELAKQLEKLID